MLHLVTKETYFYHIPKTGGRAYIQQKLNTSAKGHSFVTHHAPGMKVLTFLRCPVDRFLSCFYMFTTTYKDDLRQDHIEQRKLLKEDPLSTLNHIINNYDNI